MTPTTTLTSQQYKTQLGQAVCAAVEDLNKEGALSDSEKFGSEFENTLQAEMVKLGFDVDAMLQAKTQYFTTEEHEKLLKLHLTWCLLNLSSEDATKSQS